METEGKDFFSETKTQLEQYVQDRIWLLRLQISEKMARMVAVLFTILMIGLLGFFVILFLSMMAGFYFASLTGSFFFGFGIVASFYLFVLILLIASRKWIQKKIMDKVIAVFFAKTDTDEKP